MPISSQPGGATRQDGIRLRNLINGLAKELESGKQNQFQTILSDLETLIDNEPFWRQPGEGLALFYSPNKTIQLRSSSAFREIALASPSFFITPLLPLANDNINFTVLALSQQRIRILEADMFGFREKQVDGLPDGIEDALWYKDTERVAQRQGATSGSSHGQAEDVRQHVELKEYAQAITKGLQPYLKSLDQPLILAGAEPLQGIFRKVCRYRQITEEGISGNPDHIGNDDLYDQARAIARPIADKRLTEALENLKHAQGSWPERIIFDPAEIVQSARVGRIQALLYSSSLHRHTGEVFGEYIQSNAGSTSIYEDLVDQAARHTLLSGGQVYAIPSVQLPSMVAAVLRY